MGRVEFHPDAADYRDAMRDLLARTDEEFCPPLSAREGPTQTAGLDSTREGTVGAYVDAMLDQRFLLTFEDGTLVGLQSFRNGYDVDVLGGHTPATYASTLVVHPDHRRAGHARRMYHTLLTEVPDTYRDPYVATRTWSDNDAHLSLLADLGFDRVATLEDDRGEGVGTVYYAIAVDDFGE